LINQSYNARERAEPLNGDGFGLAWYNHKVSESPSYFKSVSPAWNNTNLLQLARIIESTCILAHIRAATQGLGVTETNCHPFVVGEFAFMHNGNIGGFQKIKRDLLIELSDNAFNQLKGSTDSEHFFALLLDELNKRSSLPKHEQMSSALIAAIKNILDLSEKAQVKEFCYLNVVLTNGHIAVAARFTNDSPENAASLHINMGRKYVCKNGACYMHDPGEHEKAVVISSEPLSDDPGWENVPVNSIVVIKEGKILSRHTIGL